MRIAAAPMLAFNSSKRKLVVTQIFRFYVGIFQHQQRWRTGIDYSCVLTHSAAKRWLTVLVLSWIAIHSSQFSLAAQRSDAWSDTNNPIVKIFKGQRLDLWSLQPIRHTRPPASRIEFSYSNPVDQYIHSKLESSGLRLSTLADKRTRIRRLAFDLTGLPPTTDEVDAFIRDETPEAWQRQVERYLGSPRYGEHAARQWLDVIRYSDSNGFDWDEYRPKAWQFRDYVIQSFNRDKPLDRLIVEHLAGDELVEGEPKSEEDQESLLATGYLRMGPQDNAASLFNEEARARAELMSDLVETTGSAFLGLSMACCRCHDHKFDPLSQQDHYRLRAFFEPVQYADTKPLNLAKEQEAIRKHNQEVDLLCAPKSKEIAAIIARAKENILKSRSVAEKQSGALDPSVSKPAQTQTNMVEITEAEAIKALDVQSKQRHDELKKEIKAIESKKRTFHFGLMMTDSKGPHPPTRVLLQGDYRQEGEAVEPGFLSILDPNPAKLNSPPNSQSSGRRYTLAKWIIGRGNPLTARVMANRIWQSLMGHGLVETPDDFGLAGANPTHPELLDFLARELVSNQWSVKHLRRLIVTSHTYQQVSTSNHGVATDAENRLLWRQNLRRLTAEQLRDALLQVSGLLLHRSGGPPAWPELPPEVLQANPAFLDDNETRTKGWYPSLPALRNVRSIYQIQKRTVRVPFMETFDLPENSTSCSRRTTSTVAPQALTLLNNPLIEQIALGTANEVSSRSNGDTNNDTIIQAAFEQILQRRPKPNEIALCKKLLETQSIAELCRVLFNLNEFVYLD